ncbi:putative Vacuolar protein 8 [Paratrimastix pyriformis]|uniref:Vacuolar protein 8 n=1 Tax=Paratrimastix pyriformis TaxID=342808 RepID=A0ABQ8UW70_9EUKA|nr:putative Vacuolar protein 8 [Paratrimastix pyriformis]
MLIITVVSVSPSSILPPPDKGREQIRSSGGLAHLVNLLTCMNEGLIQALCAALCKCAQDPESSQIISQRDGLRRLWSLFRSSNNAIIAAAGTAVAPLVVDLYVLINRSLPLPCHQKIMGHVPYFFGPVPILIIAHIPHVSPIPSTNAALVGRQFVGALEQVLDLLALNDPRVQAAACAVIANLALDDENLAVMTENGVLPMLAGLTATEDTPLRIALCNAITTCCKTVGNAQLMGRLGGVVPLVDFMHSTLPELHRATARALRSVSQDRPECTWLSPDAHRVLAAYFGCYPLWRTGASGFPPEAFRLRSAGAVQLLVQLLDTTDPLLQEAAAGCISNIRRTHLVTEELPPPGGIDVGEDDGGGMETATADPQEDMAGVPIMGLPPQQLRR